MLTTDFKIYTLKELRKSKYTQEKIANVLGITLKAYNMKENNKREFTGTELCKLCIALELSTDQVNEIFFDNKLKKVC